MSLLLDALQRASKDKEKAASAVAASSATHAPPEPELSLTPTDAKGAKDANAAPDVPLPVLVHEVIAPVARTTPVSTAPASAAPTHKRPPEPELSLAPQLPQELTLDLGDVPTPAPTPHAQPTLPKSLAPVDAAGALAAPAATTSTPTLSAVVPAPSIASAQELAPASIPEPAPEPEPEPELVSMAAMAPAPPSLSSTTANPSRVAQDMRRAYASASAPTAQRRRRVLLGVGLVIALAVVVAGLALKFLEGRTPSLAGAQATPSAALASARAPADPASATPAAPAAPAAQVEVAQVSAPVPPDIEQPLKPPPKEPPVRVAGAPGAASLPTTVVATAPAPVAPAAPVANAATTDSVPTSAANPASTAAASTAITEKSNDVLVQGGAAKQAFSVKTRGPSSLEVGYAALVAGRLEDAAQAYGQALKANSEERDALLGLAYIAQKRGQRDEAQSLYRRVLRQEPSNAIASAALLGLDADNDGSQTASRARDLAMRQPDSAATMAMAGNAAVREGLLADAVQLFARAQFLEPANPLHAYNHAVALDRLGQFAAAAVQYEKVLKLSDPAANPGGRGYSPDAVKERLAQLRQALGTPAQAVK